MKTLLPLIALTAASLSFSTALSAQVVQTSSFGDPEKTPGFDRPNPRESLAELRGTIQARPVSLLFTGMDTDFNKAVSRAELSAGIDREWKAMQPSFSQKVSAIKFSRWAEQTLGSTEALPSRLSFDSDLDNQITKDEFSARLIASFDALDGDDDAMLSRAELVFTAPRGGRIDDRREERAERGGRDQTGQRPPRR